MQNTSYRGTAAPTVFNKRLSWLADFPPLGAIHDSAWIAAAESAREVVMPRRSAAFHESQLRENFVLVRSGKIRVVAHSEAGREIVLYTVKAGEVCLFNAFWLLGQENVWPATGTIDREMRVVLIEKAHFKAAFDHSSGFRNYVCGQIASQVHRLLSLFVGIAFRRLDSRLAELLCDMVAEQGQTLKVTHQELSVRLGSPREVVTRMLKEFEARGWLRRRRGCIDVLDLGALANFCRLHRDASDTAS